MITNEGVLTDDIQNQNIDQTHLDRIELIALPTIFFNNIDSQEDQMVHSTNQCGIMIQIKKKETIK